MIGVIVRIHGGYYRFIGDRCYRLGNVVVNAFERTKIKTPLSPTKNTVP